MTDSGVTITYVCGYCGAKVEQDVGSSTNGVAEFLPKGWVRNINAASQPHWWLAHPPPPSPIVFCSQAHCDVVTQSTRKFATDAMAEATILARQLYTDSFRNLVLEGRGAVTALGELAGDDS